MTDEMIPAEKVREVATAMREAMRNEDPRYSDGRFLADMSDYIQDLHDLLPSPTTLADMTNIYRATKIISDTLGVFTFSAENTVYRLAKAGLLMPDGMSTLTVGSEWDDAAALARACDESRRDQIVVLDADGYAFVWSHGAEWWEGSAPPLVAPYTIIHTGKEADQ